MPAPVSAPARAGDLSAAAVSTLEWDAVCWAFRGITVHSPWGACIACGAKTVENRSWGDKWRGPILIHQGATHDERALRRPHVAAAFASAPAHSRQLRHVVATAVVSDCHEAEAAGCCGVFAERGGFHFVLTDIVPLPVPVSHRGRQRLWVPTPALLRDLVDANPAFSRHVTTLASAHSVRDP